MRICGHEDSAVGLRLSTRSRAGVRGRLEHGPPDRQAARSLGLDPQPQPGCDRDRAPAAPLAPCPVLLHRWPELAAALAARPDRPAFGVLALADPGLARRPAPACRGRVRCRPRHRPGALRDPEPAGPAAAAVRLGPSGGRRIDAPKLPLRRRPARPDQRAVGRARAPDRRVGPPGPADRTAERDRPGDDQGHGREGAGARGRTGRAARRIGSWRRGDRRARAPALAVRPADPAGQHRPLAAGQRPGPGLARVRRGGAAGCRILDRRRRSAAPAVARARAAGRHRRSGPLLRRNSPCRGGRGAPRVPSPGAHRPAGRRRRGVPRGHGGWPAGGLPRSRRAVPAGHGPGRRQGARAHARAGGARSGCGAPSSGRRARAPAPHG